MKSLAVCLALGAIATTVFVAGVTHPEAISADDGWTPLFNGKNFDGWYSYTENGGKNNDPTHVFKIEDGAVHILDVAPAAKFENGYLSTVNDYSNVRIHAEYKWGTKRATEGKRNSGLLYLAGGADAIYPRSIECQIEESDVGDMWIVNGAQVTGFLISPTFQMYDDDRNVGTTIRSNVGESLRILKSGDFEDRNGWNTVEILLGGDTATHLVNGRVVNYARDIKKPDPENPARMIPLTSGHILLEAEGSEIWFRNIKVKPMEPTKKQQ
jgi:3-keto-disaccharide hydrolase